MRYINNKYFIEGKNIDSLTKKFNTPLYCYSYKNLRENVENFKKAFKEIKPLICFSVKSNSNISLLKEINQIEPKLTLNVYKILDLENSINSKKSYGGTSFENVKKMIKKEKNG